jgi:HAD superfamily hydrolase (TIGR01549 family)
MKNFVFDFDGTLADVVKPGVEIFNRLSSRFHLPKIVTLKNLRNHSLSQIVKDLRISRFKLFLLAYTLKKEFVKIINTIELFPEIPLVLHQLSKQGKQLSIVSSNSSSNIRSILRKQRLSHLFSDILTSPFLFQKARPLQRLMNRKRLLSSETIYIGDETRDIEAARKTGLRIASVTWGLSSKAILAKENPDFLIDHPKDLLKLSGKKSMSRKNENSQE